MTERKNDKPLPMCMTSCEMPYSVDLNEHRSMATNFRTHSPRNTTEILTVEVSVFHTERQTDMTKEMVAFRRCLVRAP